MTLMKSLVKTMYLGIYRIRVNMKFVKLKNKLTVMEITGSYITI
jgi:hypothetical protein